MRIWIQRKARDVRHALQEIRVGDGVGWSTRSVRTTIVGGRPPGDDARVEVPIGIERVLRRAAADGAFRARLWTDRDGALRASGLALTPAERAILLAAPAEQLEAMVAQLAPTSPSRRSWLRRLVAAAGIVIFGAVTQPGCAVTVATGAQPDLPEGVEAADASAPPKTRGITADSSDP
ncbi:MAG TPA: Os1348 family NHLP clan protein [Armatimonadota bacterium]|nr:Os1348 family NHLP clan protein [Armatimonadota bacterium]HQK92020.1 Os1348 family NHLP clan protein [Armatimonadota bacterium]